jgi:hypothetical protein
MPTIDIKRDICKNIVDRTGCVGLSLSPVPRKRSHIARADLGQCKDQLAQLRHVYGDCLTAQIIGIQYGTINNRTFHPGTLRSIQWLWAFTFRQGRCVPLIDVLTSFKFEVTPQQVVDRGFCDGAGI